MNTEQMRGFEGWIKTPTGQDLINDMNTQEITAYRFAKQIWQAALNSQAKSDYYGTYDDSDFGFNLRNFYLNEQELIDKGLILPLYTAPQPPQSIEADRVRELEKDADRYRYIRDKHKWYKCFLTGSMSLILDGKHETLDSAIDEAMKEANQ